MSRERKRWREKKIEIRKKKNMNKKKKKQKNKNGAAREGEGWRVACQEWQGERRRMGLPRGLQMRFEDGDGRWEQADTGGDASPSYIALNMQERNEDRIVPAGLFQKKIFFFLFSLPYSRGSKIPELFQPKHPCRTSSLLAKCVFVDLSYGNKRTPRWHEAKQGLNFLGFELLGCDG